MLGAQTVTDKPHLSNLLVERNDTDKSAYGGNEVEN